MASLASVARPVMAAAPQGARSMATLQQIAMRLKSVSGISKITGSMKMVSAAKFARAERALKAARCIGGSSVALTEKAGLVVEDPKKLLAVAVSSDRGLCGGIHSGIGRYIRATEAVQADDVETKYVMMGDKAKAILYKTHKDNIICSFNGLGRKPPTFIEASFAAKQIYSTGYEFEQGKIIYNHFKNAATYVCSERPIVNAAAQADHEALSVFDDCDEEALLSYTEFNTANNIFYCMLENAASEQSARMAAMENATKNADEMADKLRMLFNRSRQAKITTELIEIISGASAMEG